MPPWISAQAGANTDADGIMDKADLDKQDTRELDAVLSEALGSAITTGRLIALPLVMLMLTCERGMLREPVHSKQKLLASMSRPHSVRSRGCFSIAICGGMQVQRMRDDRTADSDDGGCDRGEELA